MIKLNKNIVGFWFIGHCMGNWLAALSKEDDGMRLIYRFRSYVNDKAFDSEDIKEWYQFDGPLEDKDKMVEHVRLIIEGLSDLVEETQVYELMMEDYDDFEAFMDSFQALPFISQKRETLQ